MSAAGNGEKTANRRQADLVTQAIIGAAIEVHRELGPGFLESVYERALCAELRSRGIEIQTQVVLPVRYKAEIVGELRLDLLVAGCVIVEIKAAESLIPLMTAQLLSYLKATGIKVGLLVNFNVPVLKQGIRRLVL
jgi:GxxExxY protein